MQLKRYRSDTVREALALARQDLGPSALVLSTRLVGVRGPGGWLGRREVEVTAASERSMSENRPSGDACRQDCAEPRDLTPATPAGADLPAWQAGLAARLCATGLDKALAREVAGGFPRWRRRNVSTSSLRRAIADHLQSTAAGDESYAPIEVFVGPPGVGKTTTIAKIAAQERARRGVRFTLVAADGFRVGAIEQLRLYAEIIGSRFVVARAPSELDEVLEAAAGPVLVDTAGRSPRDPESGRLFEVIASRPGVRAHLVIPAGLSPRDAAHTCDAFLPAAPGRVVLTRVDETASVAPLVGPLRDRRLRISFLGTGQRVPEDLERATASALAARVLGEAADQTGVRA
jgi:flagellar biosynthesis protein FlhF